jgi:ADP-ribosyl-[dinitrogen reductase] hydrolase
MGVCVGDALGVPVEFTNRAELEKSPVTSMRGYGTWDVPAGTWSDDSSLTFCLAESLCDGFSLSAIAKRLHPSGERKFILQVVRQFLLDSSW